MIFNDTQEEMGVNYPNISPPKRGEMCFIQLEFIIIIVGTVIEALVWFSTIWIWTKLVGDDGADIFIIKL